MAGWWLCLWVVGALPLLGAGRGEGATEATPFPPPSHQGLFAVVQELVEKMADISSRQARDRTRLRRVERRGKSARSDLDVMHADIVQLRQHVTDINGRLEGLDDVTADLQLEVTTVTTEQRRLREEAARLRHSGTTADARLQQLERNVSRLAARGQSADSQLRLAHSSLREIRERQRHVVSRLQGLDVGLQRLDRRVAPGDPASVHPPHVLRDSPYDADGDLSPPVARDDVRRQPDRKQRAGDRQSVEISGDDEGDARLEAGSGDEDEFFITEGRDVHLGSGEGEVGVHGGVERGGWSVTPTPLTTNVVPTLTQAHVTTPTSPSATSTSPSATSTSAPCPSAREVRQLRQRVSDLESRLDAALPAEDVLSVLLNETERLEAAVSRRDEALGEVQVRVSELGGSVSRLAEQLASLGLAHFMERLQASLLNFTANVLTLDQWQLASQQMVNATQRTQMRITELGSRVMDNAQMTSELQLTLRDYQVLSERQYRLLQTHVIRLNNSLQDLQDDVSDLVHNPRPNSPIRPSGGSAPGSSSGADQPVAVLTSRMDDLALQLVYSDNRLAHLETRLLNSSLAACHKANSDLYQDASLMRMDQHVADAQRDIVVLKENVKRLDLGLYRLHGNAKANQEVVRKVQGQVKDMAGVKATVRLLQKEVDNLLFQLPIDCDDYYRRGYRQSGDYVIYPRTATRSLKVRCVMITSANHHHNHSLDKGTVTNDIHDDNEATKSNDTTEEGGWTVVQQRHSGKVNFTRSWAEYAEGFGRTGSDSWLGNEALHLLTAHRNYSLRIRMIDIFGGHWSATYRRFALSSKDDNYRLTLAGYHGNATDSLSYSSGMTFSTYDRDTDLSSSACARYNGGGWWYSHCQISNLNGPYDIGMIWFQRQWRDWLQLRQVVMMVKPVS